jgi:PAS domain S-box-containing protein
MGSFDGVQTANVLRNWHNVPSIFLTSFSDDATIARAARAMPYGYLTKPFKSEELKATLRVAMDRAKADARDQSERRQLTETMNGMPEGVMTVSCKGTVRFMNYAAESLTGWKTATARGKSLHEVLCWSDMQTNPVPILHDWSKAEPGEWLGCAVAQPGGGKSYLDMKLTRLTDGDGMHRGFVASLRDATERMRARAMEEVQGGRPCFDGAPMAMLQLDAEGRIERINEALLREAGVALEKVLGRTLTGLNMDPDPLIGKNLLPKLLKDTTIITSTKPGQAN